MTKKELSQLIYLNRIIRRDKKRICQWESNWGGSVFRLHSISSPNLDEAAMMILKMAEMKDNVENNTKKRNMEEKVLCQYIKNIENIEMRQIMYFRYMRGYTWQKIAFEIGYQDESVPRKRHNRYLEKRKHS